jgi:hypothetical protein
MPVKSSEAPSADIKALTALCQDFAKGLQVSAEISWRRQMLAILSDGVASLWEGSASAKDVTLPGLWLTLDPAALSLCVVAWRVIDAEPSLREALRALPSSFSQVHNGELELSEAVRQEWAFELCVGRTARALAHRMNSSTLVDQPMAAEILMRSVCRALQVRLQIGRRVESESASEEALRRIDVGLNPESETTLAYERRKALALGQLQKQITDGAALPSASTVRGQA